jgi:hypothetical protein
MYTYYTDYIETIHLTLIGGHRGRAGEPGMG